MKRASRGSFFASLCISLLVAAGCSGLAVPSLSGYRPAPAADAADLLAKVRAAADAVKTGRGEYELRISKGVGRQTLHQVVAFERPSRLRLELFASALQQLVLFAVARDGTLECLDPKAGILYRGESTPENLSRVIGVPLVAEETMLWFAGTLLLADAPLEVLWKPDARTFAIRGKTAADRCTTAHFEQLPAGPRMRSLELRHCGSKKLFFFSEFEYQGESEPAKIVFQFPEQGVRGELTRERLTLNPKLPSDKLFVINAPPQTRVENLDTAIFP